MAVVVGLRIILDPDTVGPLPKHPEPSCAGVWVHLGSLCACVCVSLCKARKFECASPISSDDFWSLHSKQSKSTKLMMHALLQVLWRFKTYGRLPSRHGLPFWGLLVDFRLLLQSRTRLPALKCRFAPCDSQERQWTTKETTTFHMMGMYPKLDAEKVA